MSRTCFGRLASLLLMAGLTGCQRDVATNIPAAVMARPQTKRTSLRFQGRG